MSEVQLITTEEAIASAAFLVAVKSLGRRATLCFHRLDSHYHAQSVARCNSGNATPSWPRSGCPQPFRVPHELRLQGSEHDDADFRVERRRASTCTMTLALRPTRRLPLRK